MMSESEDLQYAFHKELTATQLGPQGVAQSFSLITQEARQKGKGCLVTEQALSLGGRATSCT